jgi:hypothetical protein
MRIASLTIVFSALTLSGCAGAQSACLPGLMPIAEAQLFLGRNIAGREGVSDADWGRFVDEEVSPRFPDGFSVADVDGQYRNAAGAIVRERSKELVVITRRAPDDTMKLNAIRDAYKSRFNQESVLLAEFPVCAGF